MGRVQFRSRWCLYFWGNQSSSMARCEPQTCQHRQGSKKASKRAERRFKSQSREWTWASQSTEDHSLHRNRNVHPSFSTRWLYIPLKVHSSSILPMPSEARPLHFLFFFFKHIPFAWVVTRNMHKAARDRHTAGEQNDAEGQLGLVLQLTTSS